MPRMADKGFYSHGLPGHAGEIAFLGDAHHQISPLAPLDVSGFDAQMTSGQASLIGFSLGAMTVLRVAAERPDRIAALHLIAPAAPLILGEFLPDMAGASIFRLAKRSAIGLRLFTSLQYRVARLSPNRVLTQMFATSPLAERQLLENAAFRASLTEGLMNSLGHNREAYINAVQYYVSDWSDVLSQIQCPVHIYQSRADNWVPPAMATALSERLTAPVIQTYYDDLGHYGTLHRALPEIMKTFAIAPSAP